MKVFEFEEALAEVLRHCEQILLHRSTGTEAVPLLDTAGRTLAEPVRADRDQPPFDRATRDGFAVRAGDLTSGRALKITGSIRAGEVWDGFVNQGEAVEIMTGAPVPAGADSVLMVEHVRIDSDRIDNEKANQGWVQAAAGRTLCAGENVVPRASEARQDNSIVASRSVIGPAEIALAASFGMVELTVFSRPKIAIAATGDELVEVGEMPLPHQIRNSNSYGLAILVEEAGGTAVRLPIARDTREDLMQRVAEGRQSDLLLFSGGVSMGKYDLVEEALSELGAEFFFTGVKMQPGRPVVFGRLPAQESGPAAGPECYFFGLPGNPVSTQVTFHCFAAPLLRAMGGGEIAGPKFLQATLEEAVSGKAGLTRLLPARLQHDLQNPSVRLVPWHGSGDLAANARANCYAVLPQAREEFRAGDVITVLLR